MQVLRNTHSRKLFYWRTFVIYYLDLLMFYLFIYLFIKSGSHLIQLEKNQNALTPIKIKKFFKKKTVINDAIIWL